MKHIFRLSITAILFFVFIASSAHAIVVDFDTEYTDLLSLENNFITANPANPIENSSALSFVGGAVSFSGGVALRDPLNSMGNPIPGVFYGTAFSPTTSINTSGFLNPITINIDAGENFTNVNGEFISGLNTNAPENSANTLASYDISFFSGDDLLGVDSKVNVPFNNGDTLISFGFDSTSLMGALFGAAITRVELTARDLDLNSTDQIIQNEWDFLLSSVSFESASPVPVPAALPLFISALLGGLVVARPKKS
jgi:hypothetical protein